MRVMTRRLLEQQMVVVGASDSGMKDNAMWHVPQGYVGISHAQEIYRANLHCKFSVYGILYTVL